VGRARSGSQAASTASAWDRCVWCPAPAVPEPTAGDANFAEDQANKACCDVCVHGREADAEAGLTFLPGLPTVDLGFAKDFVILAAAGATSVGPTMITGDLGVSFSMTVAPAASLWTMLDTDGNVRTVKTDAVHLAPGISVAVAGGDRTAKAFDSLLAAYNDAAGRDLCPISIIGNLAGLTLYPGLYKSTSGLEIAGSDSSFDLTLDGGGDPNAVFIFQMATTLVIWTDRKVNLQNGAKAENIFWQVGSSATLYGGSTLEGNVLALQSITNNGPGAVLHGRALARISSVTLNSAVYSLPSSM
jgi:hypothetical protein